MPSHPSQFHPLNLNSSPNFLSSRLMSSHVIYSLIKHEFIYAIPHWVSANMVWCGAGMGSLPPPYGSLAILNELMAGHMFLPVFLVPKFQLFPTLVIPRRFLHASWDSESCSYCSLSLEPFSLLSWPRTLDRVGGMSRGFIIWS